MMLPNELIWVMEKLGFEWPDIDEDELRRGSEMVRVAAPTQYGIEFTDVDADVSTRIRQFIETLEQV